MTTRKQVQDVIHDYRWFLAYICLMLTIIVMLLLASYMKGLS